MVKKDKKYRMLALPLPASSSVALSGPPSVANSTAVSGISSMLPGVRSQPKVKNITGGFDSPSAVSSSATALSSSNFANSVQADPSPANQGLDTWNSQFGSSSSLSAPSVTPIKIWEDSSQATDTTSSLTNISPGPASRPDAPPASVVAARSSSSNAANIVSGGRQVSQSETQQAANVPKPPSTALMPLIHMRGSSQAPQSSAALPQSASSQQKPEPVNKSVFDLDPKIASKPVKSDAPDQVAVYDPAVETAVVPYVQQASSFSSGSIGAAVLTGLMTGVAMLGSHLRSRRPRRENQYLIEDFAAQAVDNAKNALKNSGNLSVDLKATALAVHDVIKKELEKSGLPEPDKKALLNDAEKAIINVLPASLFWNNTSSQPKKVSRRSPKKASRRRSPKKASRRRSPKKASRRRPKKASRRRSPKKPSRRRSPKKASRRRSPKKPSRRRSPKKASRRSPKKASRRRSPKKVSRRRSPKKASRRRAMCR